MPGSEWPDFLRDQHKPPSLCPPKPAECSMSLLCNWAHPAWPCSPAPLDPSSSTISHPRASQVPTPLQPTFLERTGAFLSGSQEQPQIWNNRPPRALSSPGTWLHQPLCLSKAAAPWCFSVLCDQAGWSYSSCCSGSTLNNSSIHSSHPTGGSASPPTLHSVHSFSCPHLPPTPILPASPPSISLSPALTLSSLMDQVFSVYRYNKSLGTRSWQLHPILELSRQESCPWGWGSG